MLLIVIFMAFMPTSILSYIGKPIFYDTVDESKIKFQFERDWHNFLVSHKSFRCMAGRQNLTLPVDYEMPRLCNPRGTIYDGIPVRTKVVPSQSWDKTQTLAHGMLENNPFYRCQAAAANLRLPVNYEIPSKCILDMELSSRSLGRINITCPVSSTEPSGAQSTSTSYSKN